MLDPGEQPLGVTGFSAVLFDWRGTLFHDESDADWIRAGAASIGRALDDAEVQHLVNQLGIAAEHPQVLAARERADCSAELHQAATLLEFQLAGFDDELALAVWNTLTPTRRVAPRFQHGYQKPDPRLFVIALQALGSRPAETLMVGDRASRDGGAAHVGITTLILPSMPNLSRDQAPRGLNIVLRLVSGRPSRCPKLSWHW